MNELIHYGVNGMKWGVRKDKPRRPFKRLLKQKQEINKRFEKEDDDRTKWIYASLAYNRGDGSYKDVQKSLNQYIWSVGLTEQSISLGKSYFNKIEKKYKNKKISDVEKEILTTFEKYYREEDDVRNAFSKIYEALNK